MEAKMANFALSGEKEMSNSEKVDLFLSRKKFGSWGEEILQWQIQPKYDFLCVNISILCFETHNNHKMSV